MKVRRGQSLTSTFRIILLVTVQSVPMTLRRRSNLLSRLIDHVEELICQGWVVEVDGLYFAVTDLDSLSVTSKDYESELSPYFNLERGEMFVDIGANIGRYSILVARAVGSNGRVLAIEAHPRNYRLLSRNILLNKLSNISALNIAAWNANGEVKLHAAGVSVSHSLKVNHHLGEIEVRARMMDDVVREFGLPRVDLVKIDTEGAEIEVLQGMQNTLKKYHPKMIVEVWNKNLSDFQAFMKKQGYRLDEVAAAGGGAIGLADNNVYFAY